MNTKLPKFDSLPLQPNEIQWIYIPFETEFIFDESIESNSEQQSNHSVNIVSPVTSSNTNSTTFTHHSKDERVPQTSESNKSADHVLIDLNRALQMQSSLNAQLIN